MYIARDVCILFVLSGLSSQDKDPGWPQLRHHQNDEVNGMAILVLKSNSSHHTPQLVTHADGSHDGRTVGRMTQE